MALPASGLKILPCVLNYGDAMDRVIENGQLSIVSFVLS